MATPTTATQLWQELGTGSQIDKAFARRQDYSPFKDRITQLATGIPEGLDWLSRGLANAGLWASGDERRVSDDFSPISALLTKAVGGTDEQARTADLWGQEHADATQRVNQRRADAELLGTFGPSGAGELAADLAMFGIPTARLGSMANTTRAIAANAGVKGLTKAAAKDAAFNAAAFAPADYALSLAYGLPHDEAVINAAAAGGIGGLGSPILSAAFGRKIIGKALKEKFGNAQSALKSKLDPSSPEIYIDGHYFPDEKIKQVAPAKEEPAPTVGKKSGLPERGVLPTDDVIRENISRPDAERLAKIKRGGPEGDNLLRKEIMREMDWDYTPREEIAKMEPADAARVVERQKFQRQALRDIMRDPKAVNAYRETILNKYKPKRSEPQRAVANPNDYSLYDVGGEVELVPKGAKVSLKQKPAEKTPDRTIRATPTELREIGGSPVSKAEKQRVGKAMNTAKKIRRAMQGKPDRKDFTFADQPHSLRNIGKDEVTDRVVDTGLDLHTERRYSGPVPPERITPQQFGETARARKAAMEKNTAKEMAEFDRLRAGTARAKEAREKGYNRVMRGGRPLTRKEIDEFVSTKVPRDVQPAYKQAMIDASAELEKRASEARAKANKGKKFTPPERDPMPIDTRKMREAEMRREKPVKAPKKQKEEVDLTKPSTNASIIDKTPTKEKIEMGEVPAGKARPAKKLNEPGATQKKIDEAAAQREAELKAAEKETQSAWDSLRKEIESGKSTLDDLEKRISSKQEFTAKVKDVVGMKEVPEDMRKLLKESPAFKAMGDTKVHFVNKAVKPDGNEAKYGYYNPETGDVYITKAALKEKSLRHAIAHEVIHAATFNAIRKNPKLKADFQSVMDAARKVINEPDKHYAFTSLDEFIAEGLSNPGLTAALKRHTYGSTSLWSRFKAAVMKALGIESRTTMYQEMNRLLEEAVSPQSKGVLKSKQAADNAFNGVWEKAKQFKEETEAAWKASFSKEAPYKSFRKIHAATRASLDEAAKAREFNRKFIEDIYKANNIEIGGKWDKQFSKSVIDTDYISIADMDKREAMQFMKENKDIYKAAKKYIDQTARGMKDRGAMNHPDFSNNAYLIAQRAGLKPTDETIDIIDRMISIKAMSDTDWRFVTENIENPAFYDMIQNMEKLSAQTDTLFSADPWNKIKGYSSELYDSIYRYEYKNGEAVKVVDTEAGYVQGGLPAELKDSKIGEVRSLKKLKLSAAEAEAYAEANGLGILFDRHARPYALRRVASEAQRLAIGKSRNASDIIPLTMENNVRKLVQEERTFGEIMEVLNDPNNGLILPKGAKKPAGWDELSGADKEMLPKELHMIEYINPEFRQMLLGNKEVQFASRQGTKIAERVLKDSVQHFKENVVLKNPASWVNNMVFGAFMNAQEGIPVQQTARYWKEGLKAKKEAQDLLYKKFKLEMRGKDTTAIDKLLADNEYYQMDKNGMATTVMSQVLDMPGQSTRFTDKAIHGWFKKNFGTAGDKIYKTWQMAYLSPQAKTGQWAMKVFGDIDGMSRYSMVKGLMENKGLSLEDAITKANSVYGDMDMITPVWSQALQNYGAVPFANWFFRVSGGLAKSVKDNPGKAIALYLLLSAVEDEYDVRTESWNPMATLFHTPLDMVEMSPYNKPVNYIKSSTVPSLYKKTYNAIKYEDPMSIAFTSNFDDDFDVTTLSYR